MIGELTTIGSELIENWNFVEQVTAITAAVEISQGVTATRTMTIEFAWSIDGVTYSAYMNQAALLGLAFDKDEPLYLRKRYERTGSDSTGSILILYSSFEFEYDRSGRLGYGQLLDINSYIDIEDIIRQIVDSQNYTLPNTMKQFSFQMARGEACSPSNLQAMAYAHNLTITDTDLSHDWIVRRATFQLGIRQSGTGGQEKYFREMKGRLKSIFSANFEQYQFDLTLQSVVYLGVRLPQVGILGIRSYGDSEPFNDRSEAAKCGNTWWETTVELTFKVVRNIVFTI